MKTQKRKQMEKSGIIIIAVIIVTIVAIMLLKYHVEGEKDMPYEVKQMVIISTANGENTTTEENKWNITINQKTDIYFEITRNENYKTSETIKTIQIQNIEIEGSSKYTPLAYKPTSNTEPIFTYTSENQIENELTYNVDKESSTNEQTITTEGGIIAISFCIPEIATYIGNDDKISYDATLLKKAGITIEEIQSNIKFDLTIETESGKKYKAEINLELPKEDITETGISITKDTTLNGIVFKRTN